MRLKKLKNRTWAEVVAFMETNRHALAIETTVPEFVCAKTAESHGPEAGAAAVNAYLFLEQFGGPKTAWKAVCIYDSLSPNNHSVSKLKGILSWVGSRSKSAEGKPFLIRDLPTSPDKQAGLANIMMFVSAAEMVNGPATHVMAAEALIKFLKKSIAKMQLEL